MYVGPHVHIHRRCLFHSTSRPRTPASPRGTGREQGSGSSQRIRRSAVNILIVEPSIKGTVTSSHRRHNGHSHGQNNVLCGRSTENGRGLLNRVGDVFWLRYLSEQDVGCGSPCGRWQAMEQRRCRYREVYRARGAPVKLLLDRYIPLAVHRPTSLFLFGRDAVWTSWALPQSS